METSYGRSKELLLTLELYLKVTESGNEYYNQHTMPIPDAVNALREMQNVAQMSSLEILTPAGLLEMSIKFYLQYEEYQKFCKKEVLNYETIFRME